MFSNINKVGKTTLTCPTVTNYQPIKPSKMDVSFRPLKQPSGNHNYVAIIETDEELIITDDEEENEQIPHNKLYQQGEIYASAPPENPDPFSLGNDPIKTFYVGSITVVGLIILYRMLTK
jgi:hypothetical protein